MSSFDSIPSVTEPAIMTDLLLHERGIEQPQIHGLQGRRPLNVVTGFEGRFAIGPLSKFVPRGEQPALRVRGRLAQSLHVTFARVGAANRQGKRVVEAQRIEPIELHGRIFVANALEHNRGVGDPILLLQDICEGRPGVFGIQVDVGRLAGPDAPAAYR